MKNSCYGNRNWDSNSIFQISVHNLELRIKMRGARCLATFGTALCIVGKTVETPEDAVLEKVLGKSGAVIPSDP